MRRTKILVAALALLMTGVGAACPKKETRADGPPPSPPAPETEPAAADEPPPPFAEQPDGARVAVLYTASVQGYVTPCGCTADPLGGVARLAAAVDQAKAAYGERVVFVDAGDLLFEKLDDNKPADLCQARARVELLLDTYKEAGLRATTLGPLDDVRGPAWRDERLAKREIPTLSANGVGRELAAGATLKTGRVVDAGGVKVGLTGFRVDEESDAAPARKALIAEVARLWKAGAQTVVALAQAPRALVPEIAKDVEGLDVVIQGREPGELPTEPRALGEGTFWVASGMQAQHLGIVELALDGREPKADLALDDRYGAALRRARLLDKRIGGYEQQVAEQDGARAEFVKRKLEEAKAERARVFVDARTAPAPKAPHLAPRALELTRGSAEDKEARQALDAYEAKIPELVASCEEGITCPGPEKGQATYVGVQACYACHQAAVEQWRQAGVQAPGKDEDGNEIMRRLSHATAWKTLKKDNKHKDRSCVGCHSVGFNEPGGYCKTSDVDFRDNVQCEACHGPGSKHVQSNGDKTLLTVQKVDEAVCRRCHHVPHIPTTDSFVFEDKLKHVLGPGHGEKRWRELGGKKP